MPSITFRHASALGLIAAAVAMTACASRTPDEANPRTQASARLAAAAVVPQPNPQSPVAGTVNFSQVRDIVSVNGTVTGLKPNAAHGFHVHEKSDCSAPDFSSAGGHFNPTGQPHGAHGKGAHHLGDMPPLMADAHGTATISFNSQSLKLRGPHSIMGKAIIVHRDPDDPTHQPVGNAGPRLACAVIVPGP
ncbi:MAG: superoxide dismutase family protein [Pseudomonadota bacterium]|nr:superoxide dismutase family protein [Pseudomonadota bacterium]